MRYREGCPMYAVRRVTAMTLLTDPELFQHPNISHGQFIERSGRLMFAPLKKDQTLSRVSLNPVHFEFFDSKEEAIRFAKENRETELKKTYELGMKYIREMEME